MKNFENIRDYLVAFLRDEVVKRGFDRVVFGLSGGIDSAVVARLCQLAFRDSCKALLMPHKQSSQRNLKDALDFCAQFQMDFSVIPLEQMQNAFELNLKDLKSMPVRLGNLCARMRMICLYDYAFLHNALVIGTSNKSEILLGYGTIFGDLACAINPIGDLFKSEVYCLAEVLEIPQNIITKAPSADFFEGQSDERELGFSYAVLDRIMLLLQEGLDENAILQEGLPKEALELVKFRIAKFSFKQEMPYIAKLIRI